MTVNPTNLPFTLVVVDTVQYAKQERRKLQFCARLSAFRFTPETYWLALLDSVSIRSRYVFHTLSRLERRTGPYPLESWYEAPPGIPFLASRVNTIPTVGSSDWSLLIFLRIYGGSYIWPCSTIARTIVRPLPPAAILKPPAVCSSFQ